LITFLCEHKKGKITFLLILIYSTFIFWSMYFFISEFPCNNKVGRQTLLLLGY